MSLVDGLQIWIGSNLLFFGLLVWQRILEPKIYSFLDDRQRPGQTPNRPKFGHSAKRRAVFNDAYFKRSLIIVRVNVKNSHVWREQVARSINAELGLVFHGGLGLWP